MKNIVAVTGRAGAGKDTIGDHLVTTHGFEKLNFADSLRDAAALLFGLTRAQMLDATLKETPLPPNHLYPFDMSTGKPDVSTFWHSARQAGGVAFDMTYHEKSPTASGYDVPLTRYPHLKPRDIMSLFADKCVEVFLNGDYELNAETTPRQLLQLLGTEVGRALWPDMWIECWKHKAQKHDYISVCDCRFLNEAEAVRTLGGNIVRVTRTAGNETQSVNHVSETEASKIEADVTITNDRTVNDLWQEIDRLVRLLDREDIQP